MPPPVLDTSNLAPAIGEPGSLDYGRRLQLHAAAIEAARAVGDIEVEMRSWIDLGHAMTLAGQREDAIAAFDHVATKMPAQDDPKGLRYTALGNMACLCIECGYVLHGLDAVGRVLDETKKLGIDDPDRRAPWEQYYVQLLLLAGEVELAGEHARRCREQAARTPTMIAQVSAAIAESLYNAHAGRGEQAVRQLEAALDHVGLHEPGLRRDILYALSRAHDTRGNPREALRCVQEAMDVVLAARRASAMADVRGSAPGLLERLAVTAELRDDDTGLHCYRVGRISELLAIECGIEADVAARVGVAARLHDIGKIGIPDEIVLKHGNLTEYERKVMATHTGMGVDLLDTSGGNAPRHALEIARHHHDWWDGSRGEAKGEQIPVAARIVAIADVFDALTHERVHRPAQTVQGALREINWLKGSQFDARIVDAFVPFMEALAARHADLDEFLGRGGRRSRFLAVHSRIRAELHPAH